MLPSPSLPTTSSRLPSAGTSEENFFAPCTTSRGPSNARLMIVGEAPGENEEREGLPFVGASGQWLDSALTHVGIDPGAVYLTNVLRTRPPFNNLDFFKVKKESLPHGYSLPALAGGYLHPSLICEVARLREELANVRPNLIIAAGATAAWATLSIPNIKRIRGVIHDSPYGKVLPIIHPAVIFKDGSVRAIILMDLFKAKVEMEFPEIRRPQRRVLIDPTLEDVVKWLRGTHNASHLSVRVAADSETRGGSITCLGFARDKTEAIVIPFFDARVTHPKPGGTIGSYWTKRDEIIVRQEVNRILGASHICKITQNGLYDIQYLLAEGYKLCNMAEDTMILHHALYPELPKSLDFLGSIYANEMAWKLLRPRGEEVLKRED